MRFLAFWLSLIVLILCPAARGKAEPTLPKPASVLALSSHGDGAELALADRWIARMSETRARRQRADAWLVPLSLSGGAALGTATAVLSDLSTSARIVTGASAVVAAAGMMAAILDKPEKKARWFAIGGGLFAATYGAAGFVDSLGNRNRECSGYCFNEKSIGWLGGAFFAQGLAVLPLALFDRGPSLSELQDYRALPAGERGAVARKLLARIDRAERQVTMLTMINGLIAVGILGAGAGLVQDRGNRMTLLGFGGGALGGNVLTTLVQLFQTTRLERLALGQAPRSTEYLLW